MEHLAQHSAELDRVRANTWAKLNQRMDTKTEARLREDTARDHEGLDRRLQELDREWDFERVVETEAATMGLTGLALAVLVDRRFLLLPGFVALMLLLHGTQGWYPWLPLFRRLGLRSQDEIDRERYAVKALRGDFLELAQPGADQTRRAAAAWRAVCA